MTKAERIMAALREEYHPTPPQRDIRERLAIAMMKADGQVHCRNCTQRYRPCRVYQMCQQGTERLYFLPQSKLLAMQLRRVDAIINEIKLLEL